MDVGEWLRSIGLRQYESAFRDNDIDGEVLRSLTADDLKDAGVTIVGHRRKILTAIAQLLPSPTAFSAAAEAERQPSTVAPTHAAAERRQLTVLFCDLAGSTAMSARLRPASSTPALCGAKAFNDQGNFLGFFVRRPLPECRRPPADRPHEVPRC